MFLIVIVATVLFILSSVSGLDKGVKMLSNLNVILAFLILVLTFLVGPSLLIIKNLIVGTIGYVVNSVSNLLPIGVNEDKDWFSAWTVFYWAWWCRC